MNSGKKHHKVSLSSAPWTMHEFFAGSGLVAYGLKDMFLPVWANDICLKKAAVYKENFTSKHFVLKDIKTYPGLVCLTLICLGLVFLVRICP